MQPLTKKLMEFDEEQLARLYKTVFDSADAKLVLEDLKNRCYSYETTHVPGFPDVINKNEGMRSVVLYIKSQINYEPKEKQNVPENDG